ncbi:MAG: hypothetical protein KDB54_09790 [Solirubrobacterales bacterium]|nr:hypothetical protein [Solirubrobacterales bacterium]
MRRMLVRAGVVMAALAGLGAGNAVAEASPAPVTNWVQTGNVEFSGSTALFRSQGLTSDGSSIYFSWNRGMSSTPVDDTDNVLVDNSTHAIPTDLLDSGHDHIGDIDYANGKLYAPIEDKTYAEPYVVVYDAATLQPTGERHLLPDGSQHHIAWIAIDEPRGVAYSMEWTDTGKLFVYSLDDFSLVRTVTLSSPESRIQGAEVYKGNLYASQDNGGTQSVLAIDPVTGQVTSLFDRNLGDEYESEGIGMVERRSGTMMLATDVLDGSGGFTEMRIYRINGDETPPALKSVSFKPKKVRRPKKLTLRATVSEPVSATLRWMKCKGSRKKPCAKKNAVGKTRKVNLSAGANRIKLPPSYPRSGKKPVRLKAGTWQLMVTPTDQADIVGKSKGATVTFLELRRNGSPKP